MTEETTAIAISSTQWCAPRLSLAMRDLIAAAKCYTSTPLIADEQVPEVEKLIELYEIGLAGTSERQIRKMIGQLALLYPAAKISQSEASARMELYIELLSDIPADGLAEAMREVAKKSRFFPTVAEIREEAMEFLKPRYATFSSLHSLLSEHRYRNFDHLEYHRSMQ